MDLDKLTEGFDLASNLSFSGDSLLSTVIMTGFLFLAFVIITIRLALSSMKKADLQQNQE